MEKGQRRKKEEIWGKRKEQSRMGKNIGEGEGAEEEANEAEIEE